MRTEAPQLSAQAAQIQTQLRQLIEQKISEGKTGDETTAEKQGWISFADYMQLALYAPGLGYYQNGLQKFGEQGDFITAPEMGGLFAMGLANSLGSLDQTITANILEVGAGSGAMAAELLLQLERDERLPQKYLILEPSASLQSQQYQTIEQRSPHLLNRVIWLQQLPQDFCGVIFANEVVDAIPCERIQKTPQGWRYAGVVKAGAEQPFEWKLRGEVPAAELPEPLCSNDEAYCDGYTTEIRPLAESWLIGLTSCLSKGIIYLFDYGYPELEFYHPQRDDGSLCCFSRHQANYQPLQRTGLQDITAHVDFTQLARVACNNGLDVEGFTSQAGFLLENTILERSAEAIDESKMSEEQVQVARYKLSQQVQKLTAPGQMGEVIKAISFSKGIDLTPCGFALQDMLNRL